MKKKQTKMTIMTMTKKDNKSKDSENKAEERRDKSKERGKRAKEEKKKARDEAASRSRMQGRARAGEGRRPTRPLRKRSRTN